MRKVALEHGKLKLLAGVMLAALVSACTSDASRFRDDPFSNPFKGSTRFESNSTGNIRQPAGRDMRRAAAYEPVSTASVTTQSLSSPNQSMPAPSRPILPSASTSVQGLNPSAKVSGLNPAGVASANYPALAPVAQRSGSVISSGNTGWTAVGGTPVTLGQGDSIPSLSSKYGVPASAILAVNGLSASSQVAPGQQIMIPAYNAVQGSGGAKAVIQRSEVQRPLAAAAPVPPKAIQQVAEAPKAAAPAFSAAAPQAMPRAVAPARQVGAPTESEAEKRAAAKLRELKNTKPVAKDDEEDEAPKKRVEAPKAAPKPVEDAKLKAARVEAEKARLEAEKAKAEAAKARAEAEKAKLAKAETTKLEKAKAEKLAQAQKAKAKKVQDEDDDVETTASIPTQKLPERTESKVTPMVAKAAEPKAAEPAKETASADTFRWPAKGRVISGFGARGTGGQNDGINIAVPEGTPVRAAEGGTVVHADDALKGYGKMVLVRHPNGYVSVYAHNGELNVKRGETVKRGQVIAHSGATGNVTAPQLHFELRKGSTPVDPTTRLAD